MAGVGIRRGGAAEETLSAKVSEQQDENPVNIDAGVLQTLQSVFKQCRTKVDLRSLLISPKSKPKNSYASIETIHHTVRVIVCHPVK